MKVFKLCCYLYLLFFALFVTDTFAMMVQRLTDSLSGLFNAQLFGYVESETRVPETKIIDKGLRPVRSYSILQKLDHFSARNPRKFYQRYFVYDVNYVKGNPVFLLVGGVSELNPSKVIDDVWYGLARETGAMILALEHRMYGSSYPDENWEFSTENLVYLNNEQALADLAFFISEMILNYKIITPDAKWIALGTSYGGTLAVQLRMKYPHKVAASVALDAPLMATLGFDGFHNALEQQCRIEKIDNTIEEAFTELKNIFITCEKNGPHNVICVEDQISTLRKTFKFCNGDLSAVYDLKHHRHFLFWSLTKILARALQFENGKERRNVINTLTDKRITPKALDRLGAAVRLVMNILKMECLVVNYESLVDSYQDTSLDAENKLNYLLYSGLGNRRILFQSCTERGQFETAYKKTGMFAKLVPLDFYVILCRDVFGPEFSAEYLDDTIKRTEMFYGGRDINVSKVLFIINENNFWIDLTFSGRKPWDQVTEEESVTVLLNAEDRVNGNNKWSYVLRMLKFWSGKKTRTAAVKK